MGIELITGQEREAAISAAVAHAQFMIGPGRGFVSPYAKLGLLSDFKWRKIAEGVVSGWIVERSRQLTAERVTNEAMFLATGAVPEPMELGTCAVALPALGDLVENLGLAERPIGAWSKDDVLLFVWTAAEIVAEVRTARDERPSPLTVTELAPELIRG